MTLLLERTALLILLVIIGLRPLIGEVFDSSAQAITVQGVADATPLRTVAFDVAVMVAVLLWLLARALGGKSASSVPYRWTGLEVGWLVLAVAGTISCAYAGNKRAAIVAAVNWLMLPVLTIVLANLLRRPWQIRLLMCVVVGSCAVQAYQCYDQASGALADTEAMYLQNKEAFWKNQGVPLDSPTVELFERRLKSREATGFLSHPNVAAAHLLLGGLIALAWAYTRWRSDPRPFRKGFAILLGLVGLIMLGIIATTGSLGSATAAVVGLIVGSIALWKLRWLQAHRRFAFIGGWVAIGTGVLAVIGHGWYHGRLPTDTLAFRWQYWTASARMISNHPLTGVGPQNYGYRYLQYKTIESPEEIQNAHNFLVQFAAEWGLIGLAGVILMILFGSWFATRSVERASVLAPLSDTALIPGRPLIWGILLAAGIFLVRIPLLGSDDPNFILVSTVIPLIVFGIAYAIAAAETNELDTFIDDDLPLLATGINAALFAFLLQDTINFALFVPGAATPFFAALAIPISLRTRTTPSLPAYTRAGRRWIPLVMAMMLVVIWVWSFVGKMIYALGWWVAGQTYSHYMPEFTWDQQGPVVCWAKAAEVDRLDPQIPSELSLWCLRALGQSPDPIRACRDAIKWTEEAIRRSPFSTALYRQLMHIHQTAAKFDPAGDHLCLAAEAARKIVELYPTSPEAWIALGDRLDEAASDRGSTAIASEAAGAYQQALDLDASRPQWEEIRRLSPSQRADIEAKIRELSRPSQTGGE